jgi:hypothetical protein
VTLTGTGSAGTGPNSGIYLKSGTVESENGDIALSGTGLEPSTTNDGITFFTSEAIVQSTGKGNISLTGKANDNAIAINLIGGVINAVGGNVTLTGDSIELSPSQVNGKATIQLQPLTPNFPISVGGISTEGSSILDLTSGDLMSLNGFSTLIIGRADGTGAIIN